MADVNPSFGIFYFLALFSAYYYYKYSKGGILSPAINAAFFAALVIGELMINLGISKDICGFDQHKNALIATLLPWILVMGLLKSILIVFPGWLVPFANTFGYLFVSMVTNMKQVFNDILTPQFNLDPNAKKPGAASDPDEPSDNLVNKQDIGRALEQIYTDQSILLNELTVDNIEAFWNSFKDSKLIRPSAKIEQLEQLKGFIILKDTVAEFVWMVLAGLLIVSISYNYMLNAGCSYTPEQQKMRSDVLKAQQAAMKQASDKEKNTVLQVTS